MSIDGLVILGHINVLFRSQWLFELSLKKHVLNDHEMAGVRLPIIGFNSEKPAMVVKSISKA